LLPCRYDCITAILQTYRKQFHVGLKTVYTTISLSLGSPVSWNSGFYCPSDALYSSGEIPVHQSSQTTPITPCRRGEKVTADKTGARAHIVVRPCMNSDTGLSPSRRVVNGPAQFNHSVKNPATFWLSHAQLIPLKFKCLMLIHTIYLLLTLQWRWGLSSKYCPAWAGIAQSVQWIAMGFTVRGTNPGEGEILHTRPDRPWGPPGLLYNWCRVFYPGIKQPGRGV
jgi:hypothetical protein